MLNYNFKEYIGEDFEAAFFEIYTKNISEAIIEYKNKKTLILNLADPTRKEIFKKCELIKKHSGINAAILYSRCEVIDDDLLEIFYFTCQLYKINYVGVYDCRMNNHSDQYEFFYNNQATTMPLIKGNVIRLIVRETKDINETGKYKQYNDYMKKTSFYHEPRYYYIDVDPVPPEQKDILFTCLNREPRAHRVLLVNELLKQGLGNQGVISCGYKEADYPYQDFVEKDFIDLFPMELEDRKVYTNPDVNNDICNTHFTDWQLRSFVNIVSESSCDWHIMQKEGWSQTFFTEKTAKAFIAHNLPIFFNTYGYVNKLRSFSFDVFDDIIDHSYDLEKNPIKKIEMIVSECKRLISKPKSELIDIVNNTFDRHEKNIRILLHHVNELEIQKMKTMKTFFENVL